MPNTLVNRRVVLSGTIAAVAAPATGLTRQQNVSAQATNVAFSTPTAGDLIIVMAYASASITPPTKVTGYTTIDNTGGANLNSAILAFKFSDGTETGTGTWTGATSVACLIYRNAGLGAWAKTRTAGTASPMSYGTLTMAQGDGTSWIAGFGADIGSTDVGTNAPAGMTLRTSATNIAAFDTGAGAASWSAQTAVVNGVPAGTITYTLELLAIPVAGWVDTIIQNFLQNGIGSATTAALTLTQTVTAGNYLVFLKQYSGNPSYMVSSDKGGSLVPVFTTEGGAPDATGQEIGVILSATAATTPITLTFSSATGGCDIGMIEVHRTGTGTPAIDCANKIYNNVAGLTTIPGPAFTLSSARASIFSCITTSHNTTAVADPYNQPTGQFTLLSGNATACALNQTSAAAPSWTTDSGAGQTTAIPSVAIGANVTAFTPFHIQDFEGSSDGTTVTEALLHASSKGYLNVRWTPVGGGAAMKYATAANKPFVDNIARLCDGTAFTAGAGTMGLEYLSSTGTSGVKGDFINAGTPYGINTNDFSAFIWFWSDYPDTDGSAADIFQIFGTSGLNFVNAKFRQGGTGTMRVIDLEAGAGGGAASGTVNVPNSNWYGVALLYQKVGTHQIKIVDTNRNLLGSITAVSSGAALPAYVALGQNAAGAQTSGFKIRFDSCSVDPTGASFPKYG